MTEHVEIIQILLLLLRDLTCRNSDADTTNLEKLRGYIQCKGWYHSCHKKNRNRTHNEIGYKRGKKCLFPTNNWCWRPTKMKYLERRPYHTRQRTRLHREVCSNHEHKVKKAIYEILKSVHQDNLHISTDFKILFIKDV